MGSSARWTAVRLGLVLLVTAACLLWVLHGIDPGRARVAVASFEPAALLPMLILYTAIVPVRVIRFQLLLERAVPFRHMLPVVAVSFLAVNVVPLRMGELVRPYLLNERYGVPLGGAVAALVLERLLDVFGLLVVLLVATTLVELPAGGLMVAGVDLLSIGQRTTATALVAGLVGAAGLAVFGEAVLAHAVRLIGRLSPSVAERIDGLGLTFVEGFRSLARRPARAAAALGCTATMWALAFTAQWSVFAGFAELSGRWDHALMSFVGGLTASVLVPTPGFFGSYELGTAGALRLVAVDPTLAGTFAVLMHLATFFHAVAIGLAFLVAEGWSLVGVIRASRPAADPDDIAA